MTFPGYIRKTYLYNFDPLKPHFYIVKLGFIGLYIIFLISAQKHRLWVLVRTASSTHNLYFEQKYEKYQNFLSGNFLALAAKFWIYLNRRVFVMNCIARSVKCWRVQFLTCSRSVLVWKDFDRPMACVQKIVLVSASSRLIVILQSF